MKKQLLLIILTFVITATFAQKWEAHPFGGSSAEAYSVPDAVITTLEALEQATDDDNNTQDLGKLFWEFDQVSSSDQSVLSDDEGVTFGINEPFATDGGGGDKRGWDTKSFDDDATIQKYASIRINNNPQTPRTSGMWGMYSVNFTETGTFKLLLRVRGSNLNQKYEIELLDAADISNVVKSWSLDMDTINYPAGHPIDESSIGTTVNGVTYVADAKAAEGQAASLWMQVEDVATIDAAGLYVLKINNVSPAGDEDGGNGGFGAFSFIAGQAGPTEPTTFTIDASAGENGSITPSGAVEVEEGNSQAFTIKANSGYKIKDVLVDGASVGAVDSYSFTDVAAAHSISVEFEMATSIELPQLWSFMNDASSDNWKTSYEALMVEELPEIDGEIDDEQWEGAEWFSAQVVNDAASDWRGDGRDETEQYEWKGEDDYNFRFKMVHNGSTYAMLMHITDDELNWAEVHKGYYNGNYDGWADVKPEGKFLGDGTSYDWWRMDNVEWYMAPIQSAAEITEIYGNGRNDGNLMSWYNLITGDIEWGDAAGTIMHPQKRDQDLNDRGALAAGSVSGNDYYIEFQEASFDAIALGVSGITTGDTLIFEVQADDADSYMNARDFVVQMATVGEESRKDATNWVKIVLSDKMIDTAVNDAKSSSFKIYPNPANNRISFNTEVEAATIYNLAGQPVMNIVNTKSVDISNLNNGVYLMKDNQGGAYRFVKQ